MFSIIFAFICVLFYPCVQHFASLCCLKCFLPAGPAAGTPNDLNVTAGLSLQLMEAFSRTAAQRRCYSAPVIYLSKDEDVFVVMDCKSVQVYFPSIVTGRRSVFRFNAIHTEIAFKAYSFPDHNGIFQFLSFHPKNTHLYVHTASFKDVKSVQVGASLLGLNVTQGITLNGEGRGSWRGSGHQAKR